MYKKVKPGVSVELFKPGTSEMALPFVETGLSAGFPSPAADYLDQALDLNRELVKNPSATFLGRVKGNSMKDAGIHDGDVIVIDRSLEPQNGKIALCFIDGEFTVKRIKKEKDTLVLMPENKDYRPIMITEENDFIVWGIVTYVIHKV